LNLHEQITQLSKSCFYHIKDLHRIRPSLDKKTASLIAMSIVHSKLDYCNSLYLNLPAYELDRLQHIQNCLARAVCRTSRFQSVTPVLKSLHWLKVRQRITYKVVSITYKVLQNSEPPYLKGLLSVQPCRSTQSLAVVTLQRPSVVRKKIIERSFYHEAPRIWNSLPVCLRPPSDSDSPSPVALSSAQFHKQLKSYLFTLSYPPSVT
jgi:hypothetical protein